MLTDLTWPTNSQLPLSFSRTSVFNGPTMVHVVFQACLEPLCEGSGISWVRIAVYVLPRSLALTRAWFVTSVTSELETGVYGTRISETRTTSESLVAPGL